METEVEDIHDDFIRSQQAAFERLCTIPNPPQKSQEWFAMRNKAITASVCANALGENKYEPAYRFIYSKLQPPVRLSNIYCYHGNKYETIARLIYEIKNNVHVAEFGLLPHPTIDYLSASPDGIVAPPSKLVGRMLEIKCPVTREIQNNHCPIHYWWQVQHQLECCDLEKCDFFQCKFYEYGTREEYLSDIATVTTKHYCGVLLELRSKSLEPMTIKNNQLIRTIDNQPATEEEMQLFYDTVKFIYPSRVLSTEDSVGNELDNWIAETLSDATAIPTTHVFNRIVYWKLTTSNCMTINRDRERFQAAIPRLEAVWNYIKFLRRKENESLRKTFIAYVESIDSDQKLELYFDYNPVFRYRNMRELTRAIMNHLDDMCKKPATSHSARTARLFFENIVRTEIPS